MSKKIKLFCFSFLLALTLISTASAAPNKIPYKGRINGSRVNIRGNSSINAGVLTQLQKDFDVTVIAEEGGWSKIIMPYGIATWVYAPLIKDNLVDRDSINVRSGPAVHYETLTKLKRGDVVNIIDEADGWVKITPPADVGGWVSTQFVTFLASVDNYDNWLKGEKDAKDEFAKLELFRKKEMFKEIQAVDFDLIIKKYSAFAKKYSAYPESETAKERIIDAQEKKKKAINSGSYVESSTTVLPTTETTSLYQDKISFMGKIKKLKKTKKTADYCLKTGGFFGGLKCYLVSDSLNISLYEGKNVTIAGYLLDDDKKPLVNVSEIIAHS